MKEIHNEHLKRQLMDDSGYERQFSGTVFSDTRLFHVMAGDFIVREGSQPLYLFYLVRGRAKLYATQPNGRVSLIDFFSAPCFVGEIELVNQEHELCVALSQKNYRNIVSLTQNQSFPLVNRLAAFILLTQSGDVYDEKHTQAAEYMGVTYRHLLFVIAQFTREGLLQKQKTGYGIRNRKALVALAEEMEPKH